MRKTKLRFLHQVKLITGACIFMLAPFFLSGQDIADARLLKHVKILSADSMQGRRTGTEGHQKAQNYIINQLKKIGLKGFEPNFLQEFAAFFRDGTIYSDKAANIIAWQPGIKFTDKYIVFSAHYDHAGIRNGEIYNGADDNASGVAALLEIARSVANAPLQHSIIFCSFDAEEVGLKGARYFVQHPPVATKKMLININLDMISISDKNEIYICGTYHYPQFKSVLTSIPANSSQLHIKFGHDAPDLSLQDWTFSSDHMPFHKLGIPFLYFGVEDHPHYHHPSDDFENIHQPFYLEVVRYIHNALRAIDAHLAKVDSTTHPAH